MRKTLRWWQDLRDHLLRVCSDVTVNIIANLDNVDELAIELYPVRRSFIDFPTEALPERAVFVQADETGKIRAVTVNRDSSSRWRVSWDRSVDATATRDVAQSVASWASSHFETSASAGAVAVAPQAEPRRRSVVSSPSTIKSPKESSKSEFRESPTARLLPSMSPDPAAADALVAEDDHSRRQCHLCGKVMLKTSIPSHLRLVHDVDGGHRLACHICARTYKTRSALTKHELKHTGERPYCCAYCGKTFRDNDLWNNCQRRCSGSFRHECRHCDKKFNSKFRLELHVRIHSGEKPFSCPSAGCKFRCSRKDNTRAHVRKKHKASAEALLKLIEANSFG